MFAAASVLALSAHAQTSVSLDANALVARSVKKELADLDHPSSYWKYRLRKETKSGIAVRDVIETPSVMIGRTVTWNGRELTVEERQKEEERLNRLLTDPDELANKQREQREDKKRVVNLIAALPKALLYEYDGTELVYGRETIRLRFKPNPDYSPDSRETYGFKATEGKLWIDKSQERIARLDAVLTHDVSIGWFLGRIDKGGKLFLEQHAIAPDQWKLVNLIVEANGKALFFKTIALKQKQFGSDYRRVPNNLTTERAIAMLRQPTTSTTASAAGKK
jgi:hypothetical protein